MHNIDIALTINGQNVSACIPANMTLLRFLRDEMKLTSTKNGCSQGDCGACTVIINGEAQKSCLIRMDKLQGCNVETIEGLSLNGLHPLQEAFIFHGAIQCGFCTPGMIMSAKALLNKNPFPSDEAIKQALAGNLCRCGGYDRIIKAIKDASAVIGGEMDKVPAFSSPINTSDLIGASVPDVEGVERATGCLQFADDIYMDGLLYGKLLLSEHPHAEIISIDTSKAKKLPGVRLILTAKDVPGPNRFGVITADQPVFADTKVRFIGDVLAAVFADSVEIAEKAIRHIKVEYRPLEGVFSPFQAMKDEAPKIHKKGNLIKKVVINSGKIEEAFTRSDVVVEESYFTPFLDHAFIEPEAGVAVATKDGHVTVWYPTQGPFSSRYQIASNLAIPEEKVRVISTPIGGAFGGKSDVTIEIILALAAIRSGRPVKITLTRRESLRMHTKRHAFYMHYKTGASKEGNLTALWARIVSDGGAYASWSADVLEQAVVFAGGPYVWPISHVEGLCYYTNNVIGGAFRGFGMNQVHFAIESQLDIIAEKLGLDPIEFRLKNALDIGSRTITGEIMKKSVSIKETLRQVKKMLENSDPIYPSDNNKKIGIGVASGFKNIGGGKGFVNYGGAIIKLTEKGDIEVYSSACDLGQGVKTALTQITATATGISYNKIKVFTGDSTLIPEGAFAIGQRQIMVAGNALLKASEMFRNEILSRAARITGIPINNLCINQDCIVDLNGQNILNLKELAHKELSRGVPIITKYQYTAPQTYPLKGDYNPIYPIIKDGKLVLDYDENEYRNYIAYNYATQAAVVEIDKKTGKVRVLKIFGAHDVGKAINPQKCFSQLEGSVMMGVGYALSEEFIMREGRNITKRLKQCGVPTILDMPLTTFSLVENPEPEGPFQAKGLAEIALVPTVPAIINAIYNAVGVRITSLPASPEKILAALKKE